MKEEAGKLSTEVDLQREVAPVVEHANRIQVTDPGSHKGAIEFLRTVKAAQKRVTDFFGPIKKAAHEAWKKTVAGESEFLDPLVAAEKNVKDKVIVYQREEERKRQEEERRLQAEADERARKERERLEKEAAKLRTPEKKAERLEQAATVTAPVISINSRIEKQAGTSTRKIWKARVVDPNAVPRQWLMVNEKALDAFAKSTNGQMAVPGVEFFCEESLAVGGVR